MEEKEKIKVYIDFENGKACCVCLRSKKRCNKNCYPDILERDRYRGWKNCFKVNKYGKVGG